MGSIRLRYSTISSNIALNKVCNIANRSTWTLLIDANVPKSQLLRRCFHRGNLYKLMTLFSVNLSTLNFCISQRLYAIAILCSYIGVPHRGAAHPVFSPARHVEAEFVSNRFVEILWQLNLLRFWIHFSSCLISSSLERSVSCQVGLATVGSAVSLICFYKYIFI